jgi:hypothetical protein
MKTKRVIQIIAIVLVLAVVGIGFYASDYYRASDEALATFASGEVLSERVTVFRPADMVDGKPVAGEGSVGLIFYPGGKVAVEAYAPLMKSLAEEGITCVVLEMPLNLAVLDSDAAERIDEILPDVDRWYVGGHSLGGAMAASYAAEHVEEVEGLILLAAYSTKDLTNSGLDVISIYGSEDQVLNRQSYEQNRTNLPDNAVEVIIEGGNHAQFGDYGVQEGDGTAMIEGEEQLNQTKEKIAHFIFGKS